jgi:hypothetical protein
MISVYAPSSDGNDVENYVSNVLGFISGPIAEARAEKGWPSSAELAQQENIPIGGRHTLGSKIDDSGAASISCLSGDENINSAAIELSYDHRGEARDNPIATYDAAMGEVGTRLFWTPPKMGDSCDVFVATVYRKTVDEDLHCCGPWVMRDILRADSRYELVVDGYQTIATTADLKPGDIMVNDKHIMIYVELEDGSGKIASASAKSRTSDHVGIIYFSSSGDNFDVIRWKGE